MVFDTAERFAWAAADLVGGSRIVVGDGAPALMAGHLPAAVGVGRDRVDVAVVMASQVDVSGRWVTGSPMAGTEEAVESATDADVINRAGRVVVLVDHRGADGSSTVVVRCSPSVGRTRPADRILTDLAVIDVTEHGLVLRETAPGVRASDVVRATAAPINVLDHLSASFARDARPRRAGPPRW